MQFTHIPDTEGPEDAGQQEDAEVEGEESVLRLLLPSFFLSLVVLVLGDVVASQHGTDDENEGPVNKHGVNGINDNVGASGSVLFAGSSVPDRTEKSMDGDGTEDQGHSGLSGEEVVTDMIKRVERMISPDSLLVFSVLDGLFTEGKVDNEPANDDDDTEPQTVVVIHIVLEVASVAESGSSKGSETTTCNFDGSVVAVSSG